jgi:1,6-anhydro-N-acetylmuramate kinase
VVGAGPDGVTGAQVGAGAAVEAIGFDGDSVEAQCFAYCALRSQRDLPISFPTTTGAPKPMTGGVFSPDEHEKGPRLREALFKV